MKNNNKPTYRERLGLKPPPQGAVLEIRFMAGLKWFVQWPNCPDEEDIVEMWFSTKKAAIQYANKKGYKLKEQRQAL